MARKITIRRVGTIFPALCLVVIVFISVCVIWLSTSGLPGWALRRVEKEAAEYGLDAKIGAIRLALSSGLAFKVEDTTLSLPFGEEERAELKFRKLLVDYNIFELASGQSMPSDVQLRDARIVLPLLTEQSETIEATDITASLHFFNKGELMTVNSSASLQGIRLNFRGDFPMESSTAMVEETEVANAEIPPAPKRINLDKLLEPHLPQLRLAHSEIARQRWTPKNAPTVDIKLRCRDYAVRAEVTAEVPSYELGEIHFRQAALDFLMEDDSYIINKLSFRTENPYSEVTLRGGYDRALRQLSFTAESNAALVQIAEAYYGEKFDGILSRVYPDSSSPPHISLRGNVDFAENFALNSITLRGKLEQNGFNIGSSNIDRLELSFFLSDGNFNIDCLRLDLADGFLEASANSGNGKGQASLNLKLPADSLQRLASNICGCALTLPEGLDIKGNVAFSGQAGMDVNEFIPGKTRVKNLVPELRTLTARLSLDSLTLNQTTLQAPDINLELAEIVQPSATHNGIRIGQAKLSAASERISTPNGIEAEQVRANSDLSGFCISDLQDIKQTLSLDSGRLEASAAALREKNAQLEALYFKLTDVNNLRLTKSWQQLLVDTKAELTIDTISQTEGLRISNTRLNILPQCNDRGTIEASMMLGERELCTIIHLDYSDAHQNGWLSFALEDTEIPLGEMRALLTPLTENLRDIELPELVHLGANGSVNINDGHLRKTHVRLRLPELVRTPYSVPVHRGKRISLSLDADATIEHNAEGELLYGADLTIRHTTGSFSGRAEGNLNRFCHITGSSDIRVDIINQLIDQADAHSIMRDFRFDANSATRITDIDTTVQYDRGLSINSYCKAQLLNTDFLIGAIQSIYDKNGTAIGEKLRTDMGSNPYSRVFEASCGVKVDVQMGLLDKEGSPLPDRTAVILHSPYLDYDNRPWLKRCKISKGARNSIIKGESIVFDLDQNGIVLNNLEGTCYPAYAFGMYFAPLQQYMADVKLQRPVRVHTKRCEFPISKRSEVPISGLIRVQAPTGATFHFIGTDIPLENFSGFINLSNDFVFLDKMNAETWEGVLNGAVKIGISSPRTTIDGQLTASNLNLRDIAAAYGTKINPALCNGNIRFRASSPELNDIQAYGEVSVQDGDLLQLGIFQPVGSLITDLPNYLIKLQSVVTGKSQDEIIKANQEETGFFSRLLKGIFHTTDSTVNSVDSSTQHIPFANHFMRYDIQQASARFDISKGYLYTRDMQASGYNLDVDMKLRLNLDTMEIRGNLWPRISSVPTIIISPITFLSDYLIDIVIFGSVDNIQWKFTLDRIMRGKKQRPSVTDTTPEEQKKKQ